MALPLGYGHLLGGLFFARRRLTALTRPVPAESSGNRAAIDAEVRRTMGVVGIGARYHSARFHEWGQVGLMTKAAFMGPDLTRATQGQVDVIVFSWRTRMSLCGRERYQRSPVGISTTWI